MANLGGLSSQELKVRFLRCLHTLTIGLVLDGVGQMIGYAIGVGNALEKVAQYEANRFQHIRKQDRIDILDT